MAQVNWTYPWLWRVGFVQPTTGDTDWWIVPCLHFEVLSHLLEDVAQHFGVGEHQRVVFVVAQASFHTSGQVRVPEGIHLLFLPPQSPEWQPAERLWPLTNEAQSELCQLG
jgi:hypothetical protein